MTMQGVAVRSSLERPMPSSFTFGHVRTWVRMLLAELLCLTSGFWPE